MSKVWKVTGALLGAAFVILGAVMQHVVGANSDMLVILAKAQHYHMLHVVMLIVIGMMLSQAGASGLYSKLLNGAAVLFLLGIFLFSGNLYLKAADSSLYMLYLVPVGGTMFIAGWLVLAAGFIFQNNEV